MIEVVIVVRENNSLKPEFSLQFNLPELPRVGDYVSISRPDEPEPYSEDVIVEQVWWRLSHPNTAAYESDDSRKIGEVKEIFVECSQALGPWASDAWRRVNEGAKEFKVSRLSYRQSDVKPA